jgi:hypothetical protein
MKVMGCNAVQSGVSLANVSLPSSVFLKMEALRSSDTLLTIYQITRLHILEDGNPQINK